MVISAYQSPGPESKARFNPLFYHAHSPVASCADEEKAPSGKT